MSIDKTTFPSRLIVCFTVLIGLIILHVIPLPILETLVLYVLVARPYWFKNLVDQIYAGKSPHD